VAWGDRTDDVEVEPSLYAADFTRLGEQVEELAAAGARVFHFDIGDGHFIRPVTVGPVVLRAITPIVHGAGGVLDCHLMVTNPASHFEEIAASGGDSVTFHVEAVDDPRGVAEAARSYGLAVGVAFNPGTDPTAAAFAADRAAAELVLCMSIHPGYSGQAFMPEALPRIERTASLVEVPVQVDGGVDARNARSIKDAGATLLVAGSAIFSSPDPPAAFRELIGLVR
jgi:ribulose-phosphate 3-epimerase